MPVVVVTDSTASLSPALAARRGVVVVPMQVVIGTEVLEEGPGGATPAMIAEAMRAGVPVSTSRPAPAAVREVYDRAAAAGAEAIVSVHLSGGMSGTVESAQLAARGAPVPVTVVDTRQVGIATGYAALAAADALEAGADARGAATAARRRARGATSLFYVDTLEHLRRGGRVGTAAALVGGALAVKPLLRIEGGRVERHERVRTASRALARLEEIAVHVADDQEVEVCVAHLASPDRAGELAEHLSRRLVRGLGGRPASCTEVGAVLGAHAGPGLLAVCVSPL